MTDPFARTDVTLGLSPPRRWAIAMLAAVLPFVAWTVWFFGARVGVRAATDNARLEVAQSALPIEAPVDGRVVEVRTALGREVREGEILVRLEDEQQQLQIDEERTRHDSSAAQIASLRAEIVTTAAALEGELSATRKALEEGVARFEESEAASSQAQAELARAVTLREGGQLSEAAWMAAETEAKKRRAAAETARLGVERLRLELASKEQTHRARQTQLERSLAELEGHVATSSATLARLDLDQRERQIRAPASGRLGEWTRLGPGAIVRRGDRLGSLIPADEVKVVAEFAPAVALGRIRPGQRGRLRLVGFPWPQFGSVALVVTSVASEPRAGSIRVELQPLKDPASHVPLEHGLPGAVEIEIESIAPIEMALRAAGQKVFGPASTSTLAPTPTPAADREGSR